MMAFLRATLTAVLVSASCAVASGAVTDLNAPFGWVTMTDSLTLYPLIGGGEGRIVTLVSDGGDMHDAIATAIARYDVIVLDGSQGDFRLSRTIELRRLTGKTIVGTSGARLCTQWEASPEVHRVLDEVGVKAMSGAAGTGGVLSNGETVNEECEYFTRQTLIDHYSDPSESYRCAGIFYLSQCSNMIIRNLTFVGPGAVDVGGTDLITCYNDTHHLWVDHCEFVDGLDGNLDITAQSDYVTVSWCWFRYTSRSYDHQLSCLVGSSDDATADRGHLRVTFAHCHWGEGCKGRMPMVRYGLIHLLGNYYDASGGTCINARRESRCLVESCSFTAGISRPFVDNGFAGMLWVGNDFATSFSPLSIGDVSVPYAYPSVNVLDVPASVIESAGATLDFPLQMAVCPSLPDASTALTRFAAPSRGGSLIYYDLLGRRYWQSHRGGMVLKRHLKEVIGE